MAGPSVKKSDFGSDMLAKLAELEKKSGIRLEIPQKILLAEIGTLEQLLSILVNDRVDVSVVEQEEKRGVILRKSVISTGSGRVLVKAQSKIHTRNIPKRVAQMVRARNFGIGSVIQKLEIESFRKIIEIGYDPHSTNLFRKYRIMIAKKVGFEIKEEFLK